MSKIRITINWEGPFTVDEVINNMKDSGKAPEYGNDFGLYQIYGTHILCGKDTLLYIGKSTGQCFSTRLKQHNRDWIINERDKKDIKVFIGRTYNPKRHSSRDKWE